MIEDSEISLAHRLRENGYLKFENEDIINRIALLRSSFENNYYPTEELGAAGRKQISLYANSVEIRQFILEFSKEYLVDLFTPVFCVPCVTHYTANDRISGSFGLGWHQDWPSMASSKSSVIMWTSLTPVSKKTHGLEIIKNSHTAGIYPGSASDHGWIVDPTEINEEDRVIPDLQNGGVLVFSSFMLHRTYVNPDFKGYKMSISQRFDNLEDEEWRRNIFPSAYSVAVDRSCFKKFI